MKSSSLFILITCTVILNACAGNNVLTYQDVVSKLYDLPGLAALPAENEKGALASSYDRRSEFDSKTGKYIKWHANADFKGYVRREGEYLVLADIKGPGIIWRIWSASVGNGKVKMYLDGKLVIDLPWEDYFSGKVPPFNRDALVYTAAKGKNNYTPIPFQKSCKIITKLDDKQADRFTLAPGVYGKFYHFNYTLLPPDTKVETFKMNLSNEANKALDKANKILGSLGENPVKYPNAKTKSVTWEIPPGKSKSLVITGNRAITSLKIKIPKKKHYIKFLRQMTLSINWDNEKSPSVWAPLGEFFGTGPGINTYKTLVLGEKTTKNPFQYEFYSYWYMPFDKNAKITINNETDKSQKISLNVQYAPLNVPFDKLCYFHAKWHRDLIDPAKNNEEWLIVDTKGGGRFVGNSLNIWNPGGRWWGEGDEKFFVDGEKFPSSFGTGSEDYFGFAWCRAVFFEKAYHAQPANNNNTGHISVNRWRISDNVPFRKSFRATIEKYFKNSRPTLYDGVAYWYLSKNGIDNIKPTPLKERLGYYAPFKLFRIPGVIEAEKLPVTTTKGILTTLYLPDVGWSACEQFELLDGGIGATIEFKINQTTESEKNLIARVTKADDYANLQFYFNGKKVGDVIDCYSPNLKLCEVNLGKVKVKKGENSIKVKIVGVSSDKIKRYVVGIDYFKFE